jgi:U3 small nucleolar RNA-associated protein 21
VDFSPNDQFLATTHCDEIGVFLWSNIQAFDPRPVRVIDESEVPKMVSMLPQVKVTDELDLVEEDESKDVDDEYESPEVIDDCVTVTGLPNSRWISLVNLKLIKERNKVVDVKVPVKVS